jgi:hypothetical protein
MTAMPCINHDGTNLVALILFFRGECQRAKDEHDNKG